MSIKSFMSITLLLFLIPVANGHRNRQSLSESVSTSNPLQSITTINLLELKRVCQDQVVAHFQTWFPNWIVQKLKVGQFVVPLKVGNDLTSEVDQHINLIEDYLRNFNEKKKLLKDYARIYFDMQVMDLLTRVNEMIDLPFTNQYDKPEYVRKLEGTYGPNINNLIDSVAQGDLGNYEIKSVGDMFIDSDHSTDLSHIEDMKETLENLKRNIEQTLYKILDVFMELDDGVNYQKLSGDQKDQLQTFYDKFVYLIRDDKLIKSHIMDTLIGTKNSDGQYDGEFFTPDVYNDLMQINSVYSPSFNRDKFISSFSKNFRLSDLHDAANRVFFSWSFLKQFPVRAEDLGFQVDKAVKKAQGTDIKRTRKIAKLHLMLYKIYTIARNNGLINHQEDVTDVDLLWRLYNYVLDTKDFNQVDLSKPFALDSGLSVIVKPEKFRRHYLPLLNLICEKIDAISPSKGCKLESSKDKTKIARQYRLFGNYDEIKQKQGGVIVLPPKLVSIIHEMVAKDEMKKFEDELDQFEVVYPAIIDPAQDVEVDEFERGAEELPEAGVMTRAKAKTVVGVPVIHNPQVQEAFNNMIGNRFLTGPENSVDDSAVTNLMNFYNNNEASDNLHKKSVIRVLILKYIHKISTGPTKTKQGQMLLEKILPQLIGNLRRSFEFSSTAGIKNFLMRTINRQAGPVYASKDPWDKYFHTLDFIFFIDFATEDRLNFIKNNQEQFPEGEYERFKVKSDDTKAIMNSMFYMTMPNAEMGKYRTAVKKTTLFKNSLVIEKLPAFNFLIHFFDFFRYYTDIPTETNAVFTNYHRVYFSFYTFLNVIRREYKEDKENVYHYVLERLEQCLDYTEKKQNWDDAKSTHALCHFSHRKYAEMYFFYKVYLIQSKKPFASGINEHSMLRFNTHTRIFLLFAHEYSPYQLTLNTICEDPQQADESICVSWKLFNSLMNYIHSENLPLGHFQDQVQKLKNLDNVNMRINIINALEAVYMVAKPGRINMVDWEKVMFVFDFFRMNKQSKLHNMLEFKKEDKGQLVNYLKRTYQKLTVDPHEAVLARTVQEIMNGNQDSNPDKDSLLTYLHFANEIVPFYIKLFLQFSTKDAHFERIAQVLIDNKISFELIRLNDIDDDDFFISLASSLQDAESDKQALTMIHRRLKEKYGLLLEKCQAVTESSFLHESGNDDFDADPLEETLVEIQEEQQEMARLNEKQFDNVVLPQIISVAKVNPPQELAFDESVQHKVVLQEIQSTYNKQVTENLPVDSENSFELSRMDSMDSNSFESDLEDEEENVVMTKLNGVPVQERKRSFIDAFSIETINKAHEMIQNKEDGDVNILNDIDSEERKSAKDLIYTGPVTRSMTRDQSLSKDQAKQEKTQTMKALVEALMGRKAAQSVDSIMRSSKFGKSQSKLISQIKNKSQSRNQIAKSNKIHSDMKSGSSSRPNRFQNIGTRKLI